MVVITFENTSQAFYFCMEIFDTGINLENSEQKRVDYNYLIGIKNKTTIIIKNSAKCDFAKN